MNRTRTFAILAFLLVFFDLAKFWFIGGPNIINWHSFVHPAWVFFGFGSLLIANIIQRVFFTKILFWVFFTIFCAALLNQYLNFSEILTYNCMLFNAIFVAIYFTAKSEINYRPFAQ